MGRKKLKDLSISPAERRRYVRMSTVFPVELKVYTDGDDKKTSSLLQAFARDVSDGGMCLELKSFGKQTEKLFLLPRAKVALTINADFSPEPIQAKANIAWLNKVDSLEVTKYLIGVSYTEIDISARKRIWAYANKLLWMPRLALLAGLVLIISLGVFYWRDQQITTKNRMLVNELVSQAEKKSESLFNLSELQAEKVSLQYELATSQGKLKALETSVAALQMQTEEQKKQYEKELADFSAKERLLTESLAKLDSSREKLISNVASLDQTAHSSNLFSQLSGWIRSHQNLKTGLVTSFEGDPALEDWSFTYDQALVIQSFLLAGENDRAAQILSFFETKAPRGKGAFFNAYNAADGGPAESVIQAGPNLWLGLSALEYQHRTKDGRFLPLARAIGDWALKLQDAEGGLKGGPDFSWYSTEHNLDAFAFYRRLGEVTGEQRYISASKKVLEWIKKYAYTQKEPRVNRGKGDSSIATDTFAWSVAAIGPKTLLENGFDPEAILDFAEKNCAVTVNHKQPDGNTVKIKGFDFSKNEHLGRGGVISTEWTAQMIVSYQVLARYFAASGESEKQALYSGKAQAYSNELQKLMITSPSRTGQGRGCLPYASSDNVDTGHGWRTPKGKLTGSLAATSYALFAEKQHNPFGDN